MQVEDLRARHVVDVRVAVALHRAAGHRVRVPVQHVTGLVAVEPLLRSLDWPDLTLLLLGGLFYSLGVRLHLAEWLRFHTALWHGCVLAGAASHYAVVLRITAAAG